MAEITPRFVLTSSGNQIPTAVLQDIVALDFESTDFGASILDLTVNNAANSDGNLRYIDSAAFAEGNVLEVSIGYDIEVENIGKFNLLDYFPEFNADFPTLKVRAYDDLNFLMNEGRQGKAWQRTLTIKEVVEQIVSPHGLSVKAGTFAENNTIAEVGQGGEFQPVGESNFDFLRKVAETYNLLFFMNTVDGEVWFGRKDDLLTLNQNSYDKLTYKYHQGEASTIVSFSPSYTTNAAPTKLVIVCYDKKRGTRYFYVFENTSTGPNLEYRGSNINQPILETITSAAAVRNTLGQPLVEFLSREKFKTQAKAQDFAEQWFAQRADNFITGNLTVFGTPKLRACQVHTLEGLGARLSGDYYFQTVTHKFSGSSEYVCDCTVNKVPT